MKKVRFGFAGMLLAAGILGLPALLWAGITNDGNDAVLLELQKDSGNIEQRSLFPGQAITIPDDTTDITVVARSSNARGDEHILVKIVDNNGTVASLKEYGASYHIGSKDAEEKVILKAGRVNNVGNINVNVRVWYQSGLADTRELYIGQPMLISKDAKEVEVIADKNLRGDEIVKVTVVMPDGEQTIINSLGGKATLKEQA